MQIHAYGSTAMNAGEATGPASPDDSYSVHERRSPQMCLAPCASGTSGL